jgi:hypothetical protein
MCFCFSEQMCLGLLFFAKHTVTGIVLEEFLMPILEEEGPHDMLFQQDGAPPHFHKDVTNFLNRKFPNGLAGADLSLDHLICLTLLTLIFSFGEVHQGCCVHATIGCSYPQLA